MTRAGTVAYIKKMFSEDSNVSITRWGFAVLVVTACSLAVASIWVRKDISSTIRDMLAVAAALKIGNKFAERKRHDEQEIKNVILNNKDEAI
jgi:hypothetical protein